MENNTNYKYYAFISYSHEDEEFAKSMQKKLTEYKLPSVIRKANPLLPDNVRPIFRDVTNLTTGMLQRKLNTELEYSKFLIVLCSPNSAKPNDENKHWVNNEVQHFIDIGRIEYIIPVIVGGEPHAKNPEEECFCPALLSLPGGDELLGIDIRNNSKKKISFGKSLKRKLGIPDEDDLEEKGIVHIVAKMLGLNIDDLWDWNKKAQKRKAYTKLFSAAACFIVMLSVGLTIYFKKFHVYHEYYVDYVDRTVKNGTDFNLEFIGLGKLSKKDIKSMYRHYKFDYRDGKLRRIVYENSSGIPKPIDIVEYIDRPMFQELEYNESTGLLQSIISKNECNSIIMKYVYEQQYTVIDLKDEYGCPIGVRAKTTDVITEINNKANIKSYKLIRNNQGFVIKKMYYQANGAENKAKDSDGVSGFEYVLDNLGRPVQIWYLGKKNNDFQRQANKNGIAGYFLEYDNSYNISKTIYVNCYGIPTHNNSNGIGCKICVSHENGNKINQSYEDEFGNTLPNSYGVAYIQGELDEHGNMITVSFFDENFNYINAEDNFAIIKNVYDKKGNCIETSFYDLNNNLVVTKNGYAIIKNTYNKTNQVIETSYYDSDYNLSVNNEGYYVKNIQYNSLGYVDEISFWDSTEASKEYRYPCLCSDGYCKRKYIYTDNHMIKEEIFFTEKHDCDGFSIVPWYKITYEYEKGNVIEKKYFDYDGNPMNNFEGICRYTYTYDDSGNITNQFFFDSNGVLKKTNNGYVGCGYTYDEYGNNITESFYSDNNKTLCDATFDNGFAYNENQFDDKGNIICSKQYDSNNNLLRIVKFKYDENNNNYELANYDGNNNLMNNNDNWAKRIRKYNKKGQIVLEMCFDENNNYVVENGIAIKRYKYDSYGRVIEIHLLNDDESLLMNDDLFSIKKLKYDYAGNIAEISYYKDENTLVDCADGFAIEQKEYDIYRNCIKIQYYDVMGMQTNCKKGYATCKKLYSFINTPIRNMYYNVNGILVKEEGFNFNNYPINFFICEYDSESGLLIHKTIQSIDGTAEDFYY